MAGRKGVVTVAAIVGFVLLNIAGIAAIAGGMSSGSLGSDPQVQEDGRFTALSRNSPDGSVQPRETTATAPVESSVEEPEEGRGSTPGRAPLGDVAGLVGAGPGGRREEEDAEELRELLAITSVSISEAGEVAAGEVSGEIFESSLDSEDDAPVYEFKILADDGNLYEFKVDASDSEVLESEIKASREARDAGLLLDATTIDRERAESAAMEEVPGEVVENKLVNVSGSPAYEIEVLGDDRLYEVLVDATSGDLYTENE